MSVYQIICTTRRKGILGDMYFETAAASEGITDEERREIESRLHPVFLYEENEEYIWETPEYAFFKLESGRYCMCMTKAYDDSSQDCFCHGLVFDEGNLPFYPVQLIGSPAFKKYPDEEDFAQGSLPVLSTVLKGDMLTFERVSQFIVSKLEQGARDMMGAVINFQSTGQGIGIIDSAENTVLWIGFLQMSFPVKLAYGITFTTSSRHGDAGYMVCGFKPGPFLEEEQSRKLYRFDYSKGVITRIDTNFKFMKAVEMGCLLSRKTLESFHKFLSQFNYTDLNREIDGCYSLYMLTNFPQNSMGSKDIKNAFEFGLKYGSSDIWDDIFQTIEPFMDRIAAAADMEAARSAAEFVFKTALNSKKLILMNRACCIFFSILDHPVLDGLEPDVEGIVKLYKDMVMLCGEKAHAIFRYAVSPERVGCMISLLTDTCTPATGAIYLNIMFISLIRLGYLWNQALHINNMGVFLDMCMNSVSESGEYTGTILEACAGDQGIFARVTMLLYNRAKHREGVRHLLEKFLYLLDTMDDEEVLEIRKIISGMEGGKLLFEEYSSRLAGAQDKIDFFRNYCMNVFEKIPAYEKQHFSEAVRLYIALLPDKYVYQESVELLRRSIDESLTLDSEGLSCIIKAFEKGVSLSEPPLELRCIIEAVRRIKKARDIRSFPDITSLLDFAVWLEEIKSQDYSGDEVIESMPDIERLDRVRYMEYAAWCLPLIITHVKSPEDHKRIVRSFEAEGMESVFFNIYIKSIEGITERESLSGKGILLNFGVYLFFYLEPRLKILEETELLEEVESLLAGLLLKKSKSFIREIDSRLKDEFERRGLSIPLKWKQIYDETMGRKEGALLKGLARLFKRD